MSNKRQKLQESEESSEEDAVTVRPMLVEAAKSSRSKCTWCNSSIAKGDLRIQVVDDREFQVFVKKFGWPHRPYFERAHAVVSAKKKWLHLTCYSPGLAPTPHVHSRVFYDTKKLKKAAKIHFAEWFVGTATVENALLCWWMVYTFRKNHIIASLPADVCDIICLYVSLNFFKTEENMPIIERHLTEMVQFRENAEQDW